jgi:hypothetical protein
MVATPESRCFSLSDCDSAISSPFEVIAERLRSALVSKPDLLAMGGQNVEKFSVSPLLVCGTYDWAG